MPEVSLRDGSVGPVLENDSLRLAVSLDEGSFSLARSDGDELIPKAWTGVALADGASVTSRGAGFDVEGTEAVEDAHGRGKALTLRRRASSSEAELALTVTLYEEQPFAALRSTITNTTGRPLRVRAFHVLHCELPPLQERSRWRFYRHGWQSWSPTLTLPVDEGDLPPFPPIMDPGTRPEGEERIVGELVGCLADPTSGRAITAGFVSTAHQLSQVWLDGERGTLTAASYADGLQVIEGDSLSSERAVVDITSHPASSLQRYGDALGREMGARSEPQVTSGWCSWYHYFRDVSEDDILRNLEWLSERRDELPLEYVQIDDGYQAEIGDWLTTNEKFPRGMARLAELIHEREFKAGLWLAPFLAGAKSELFAEHPDWVLRDEAGKPVVAIQNWEQLCYALDCTRPEVIDWLEGVFRTVTEGWGYDYVKVDFVYAAAVEGNRQDPAATRAQAYRRGLAAIRRAVGERFVLGCGAPIGPSVGLVDGMRIGPDVAPHWHPQFGAGRRTSLSFPSAVNSIRNTITRFWMQGRLWQNDPDCVLLRNTETELTADEVQTLATVVGMSGGMVLDSDDLTRLPAERQRMLAKLLSLRGEAAAPLDLFERELPQVLWRATDRLLAVFNWADEATEVSVGLPTRAARLTDFWTGEERIPKGRILNVRLPAHGSRLLVVAAV